MAKVMIIGDTIRKNSFCPQCRKRISSTGRKPNGVKCPRCGFFKWEEYAKYPSFTSVPEPTVQEVKQTSEFLAKLIDKGKIKPESKVKNDKSSMASRPQLEGKPNRGSGKDKPSSSKPGAKKSSSGSSKSGKSKGKKSTDKPGFDNNK